MVFETSRLLLRPLTMDDFENFFALYSDVDVMRFIRPPKSREETFLFLQENIDHYKQQPGYGRWAIIEKESSHFIGIFMLNPSTICKGEIELGYSFLKEYWGRGFATEVAAGGMDYAFIKLGLLELVAITQPGNKASQQVLLKSGFLFTGNMDDNGRIINLFKAKTI